MTFTSLPMAIGGGSNEASVAIDTSGGRRIAGAVSGGWRLAGTARARDFCAVGGAELSRERICVTARRGPRRYITRRRARNHLPPGHPSFWVPTSGVAFRQHGRQIKVAVAIAKAATTGYRGKTSDPEAGDRAGARSRHGHADEGFVPRISVRNLLVVLSLPPTGMVHEMASRQAPQSAIRLLATAPVSAWPEADWRSMSSAARMCGSQHRRGHWRQLTRLSMASRAACSRGRRRSHTCSPTAGRGT